MTGTGLYPHKNGDLRDGFWHCLPDVYGWSRDYKLMNMYQFNRTLHRDHQVTSIREGRSSKVATRWTSNQSLQDLPGTALEDEDLSPRQMMSDRLGWTNRLSHHTNSTLLGFLLWLPSGELTFCDGKSPFWMGKSTISMAIFHCYVSSPEGNGFCHMVMLTATRWMTHCPQLPSHGRQCRYLLAQLRILLRHSQEVGGSAQPWSIPSMVDH